MPISAEPLVRAAFDALRRQVESQFQIDQLIDKVQFADGGREVQMRKSKTSALTPASR